MLSRVRSSEDRFSHDAAHMGHNMCKHDCFITLHIMQHQNCADDQYQTSVQKFMLTLHRTSDLCSLISTDVVSWGIDFKLAHISYLKLEDSSCLLCVSLSHGHQENMSVQ